MKIFALILTTALPLSSWASAGEMFEYTKETTYIKDAPPGYLHFQVESNIKGNPALSERYFRCDKVTSVSLRSITENGATSYYVRIITQELEGYGSGMIGCPVVLSVSVPSEKEGASLVLQIMQSISRKE